MPWRHRSDFKQALSTLQRLQQEAGEEPHVPTYSYQHKQWAQSSSSTWWNWQGSWWSSYNSEVKKNLRSRLSRVQLFCYSWIVYS